MTPFQSIRTIAIMLMTVTVIGCSSTPERKPLPESLSDEAVIPGIPGARNWADAPPPDIENWFKLTKDELRSRYPATFGREHNYLAISGGGQRGAFGAGLLCGWTETGTRPEFTMVTGVSTGSLIAPFAFLGPKYDHIIKEIYTKYSTLDLIEPRSTLGTLLGDAATDTRLLREKIASYVDEEVMKEIAEEFKKGRVLDIVTTNIDAARPVAWNIGRIATQGTPEALQLIRDVMLASSSLPAIFPPVMFEVEAGGHRYDEMHVDGGATSVLYLYPIGMDWGELTQRLEVKDKPNVYIIRNGGWQQDWDTVDRSTVPIALRTIDSLMGSAVLGDSYRIYLATQRDGLHYHLAYIPEEVEDDSSEPFDKAYMNKLFELGYDMAKQGYPWHTAPPDYKNESKTNTTGVKDNDVPVRKRF